MSGRAYRLRPWLVRALIPASRIGTYVLYRHGQAIYIGRSDTDLRRRLLEHAAVRRGDYFTYAVHRTSCQAFEVECSLYHAVDGALANRIHPDAPDFADVRCAFCPAEFAEIRASRLVHPDLQ